MEQIFLSSVKKNTKNRQRIREICIYDNALAFQHTIDCDGYQIEM
jgi:hypothetical protein